MIMNRLLTVVAIFAAIALLGFLALSYVQDAWGDIGVAVVVIFLVLTVLFVTVALIFAAFGLGLAHIFGKATDSKPLLEAIRVMRMGGQKPTYTLLDEPTINEPKSLPWPEATNRAPYSDMTDDDEIIVGR